MKKRSNPIGLRPPVGLSRKTTSARNKMKAPGPTSKSVNLQEAKLVTCWKARRRPIFHTYAV
eukprot:8882697-Pyramimonas_sp.AAC.1